MANTKPVGVAFSDPELVAGTTITGATITSPTITGGAYNGTVGATTASTGAFTSLTSSTAYSSTDSTSKVVGNANAGFYILSTAITANSTTTSAPAGSLGITTNATGLGKLFYADGTKWQFMAIS